MFVTTLDRVGHNIIKYRINKWKKSRMQNGEIKKKEKYRRVYKMWSLKWECVIWKEEWKEDRKLEKKSKGDRKEGGKIFLCFWNCKDIQENRMSLKKWKNKYFETQGS